MEKTNKQTEIGEGQNINEKNIKDQAKKSALEKVKQKISVIDVDDIIEAEAHKAADSYMTKSSKEKMNIFKKIWKHTFADEYYRQREINRVKKEIKEKDDVYAGRIDSDKSFHENAMKSISERFISDYEGTLSEGESKKILNNNNKETETTRNQIKDLIVKYAQGSLSDEAFRSEKVRILNELKGKDVFDKSHLTYTDNLFEIAQNAKLAIEHGAKVEELELSSDIIIGKAKSSLKTEAHFNMVDKVVDKMKKSPVGRFVNPATMSLAIGIAYSASVGIGKKVMNSKLATWGTFGASVAASTLLMGANESHRVTEERKQHGLEMAEGGTFNEGDKRREQINKYQYAMESSADLENNLKNMMFDIDANGNEIPKELKQEDIDNILSNLANIEARNQLNSKNKIDLISYSNIGNVEKERTNLTILVAQTKVELRKKIEGEFSGNFNGKKFDELLNEKSKVLEDALLGGEAGINEKDKAFSKYKTKRVASKMAMTALSGLVVGATVQEVVALFNGNVQGTIEGMLDKNTNATIQTPLEHLREWITGNHSHIDMTNAFPFNINGHEFKLPEGTEILSNNDGTFNIIRGGNTISDHIKLGFDSSGALDNETVARLGQDGILATTDCNEIYTQQTVNDSAEEYVGKHDGSTFKHISHDGWYDNNTPKPVFDQNELKLQWGGNGIDANGNYNLDISHMTGDGSFHNEFSVDAQEQMKSGNLKMVLSLTQGTQNHVFEVPIDANGHIVIDPKSEEGMLFFKNENGHAVFKGRFAEVVQSFGEKNGTEHVKTLATLVGEGNDSIVYQISAPESITINNLGMPMNTEMPYFIPILGRTPLEEIIKKEKDKNLDKKPNPIFATNTKEMSAATETQENKIEKEISLEEKNSMYDDLKMINTKIQKSEGIITLSRDDFKSEHGKKRYMDLKSIPEGIPVIFNKTELQTIGDELEKLLSKSEIATKKIESKSKSLKDFTPIIFDKDGKITSENKENNTNVILDKDGNPISKKTNNKPVADTYTSETKTESFNPKREFKIEDLKKPGTEIESKGGLHLTINKVIENSGIFGLFGATKVEGIVKDQNNKETLVSYKLKDLESEFKKGNIKIVKIEESK